MAAQGDDDVPELLSDSGTDPDINNEKDWQDVGDCDIWDDDDDDIEDEELDGTSICTKCLFCQLFETASMDNMLAHCKKEHNFDIVARSAAASLDCISYIKMINFIRLKHPSPECVIQMLSQEVPDWSGQEYMVPVDPEDPMLQFDIEYAQERCENLGSNTHSQDTVMRGGGVGDGYAETDAIAALISRVQQVEAERDMLKEELHRALKQIDQMKIAGQEMMFMSSETPETVSKLKKQNESLADEDGYFASYTHHDIHMTMLKDTVRTESYRDFMFKNPHLFEGKTVLDVGCGTGILSMFAVKSGAAKVVAVDQSNIIYQAMDIARENNMHEHITFVKGRLEDVDLPIAKFDIIISEWMGYFLLFEAMLDSVLFARDRYLSPNGCVYPDHFSMKIVGITDTELHQSKLGFWDDVYGFKMSCMKSSVSDEVNVRLVKPGQIVTEPAVIKDLDVTRCKVSDLDFASDFSLKCQADAEITALVGYFDTDFDRGCREKVSFSTGPQATPTHWEQAVMMLPVPLSVVAGENIACRIMYKKHPQDARGIIITLHIGKQKLKYNLS